jgi:iron(III) transport system permease protein
VIFLYSTDTKLASVAVVNMDEAGFTAAAAAMATMIVLTSAAMKLAQVALNHVLARHIQAWRRR